MIDRRSLVTGLLTAGIAVKVDAAPTTDRVASAAQQLAQEMEAIHGGTWIVHISHETGYAAVSRSLNC